MDRRRFLKQSAAATPAVIGSGLMLSSCKRDLRSDLVGMDSFTDKTGGLDPETRKILFYASLAPSGHNAQPWMIKIIGKTQWIIGSDSSRWLRHVDEANREVMLSLGAFIENLAQAANTFGYAVETRIIAQDRFDPDVVELTLIKSKALNMPLQKMVTRRTVKTHLKPIELKASDVNDFKKSADGHLFYFPRGTEHADFMNKEAVDNYTIQSMPLN